MHGPETRVEGEKLAQIVVERAGAEDLPEVLAFTKRCPDAPDWPASAWETAVRESGEGRHHVLLLARSADGEILGWLAGGGAFEEAELEYVLVDPAARGQGVGRQLLMRWMAHVQRAGAEELLLEVRPSNVAAVRLYEASGFKVQGARRGYYGNPREDALLMRCMLQRASHCGED